MSTRSRKSEQRVRLIAVIWDAHSVSSLVIASPANDDFGHCERIVKTWASSSLDLEVKEDKHTLQDLLFFLHIPRTGGRAYFHCFLKRLYTISRECRHSYDKLRYDPSKQNCRLLVSHDDYSVMSKLPQEKTSVVTILRNPLDRVFSNYEFSVEVAARFLVHPNLTISQQMASRIRSKITTVSTLDIWPWKHLVPWMREDLFARRQARKRKGSNYAKSNDSYDMEEFVMPLHEYINDPIALDIVHNGATFQVAGLTNNSYLSEAHAVRHCVQKYQTLGKFVLEVAKKRLDNMLYVGLTDQHKESATMFGNMVGAQVISQLLSSKYRMEGAARKISEQSVSFPDSKPDSILHEDAQINSTSQEASEIDSMIPSTEIGETANENMTVRELMKSYEVCISSLRGTQSHRRTNSLKAIPINFSKEARLRVPETVIQQIISLNSLDVELYQHAQQIFAKQHEQFLRKLDNTEKQESILEQAYANPIWKVVSLAISLVLLLLLIFLIVNAKRRTSKLKI